MTTETASRAIAFAGAQCIAAGALADVALKTKQVVDRSDHAPVLIFDEATSQPVEIDFRGSVDDVLRRLPAPDTWLGQEDSQEHSQEPRGPGRPKLGVVAREITLLPRHWEWLNRRPGGASVALRKLVDDARRANEDVDRQRAAQEAAYRFMSVMAGDREGFEEAARALFAGEAMRFTTLIAKWPKDIRDHTQKLAAACLQLAA